MDHIEVPFPRLNILVTGGTRGLGKAIGLEFARVGATVFLTYHWGSVDEEELRGEFEALGLAAPHVVESDASDPEECRELMKMIGEKVGRIDVIVSNVAFAKVINEISDLKKSTLDLSLSYSAWPLVDLIQASKEVLGSYPRYAIGVSSGGADVCYEGYDLVGASKAVLETLCRYLSLRLKRHGVRVNAIRPGLLDTASSRATFGEDVVQSITKQMGDLFLNPQSVARACVALCSGWLDSMTGQVLVVDEGWSLVSPITLLTGQGSPGAFPENDGAFRG
jgi:NAD(P)-dependent dehydrogenase (short-subunit alcohol dehydrogenase family)